MIPKYISDNNEVPDITDEREAVSGIQVTYCGFCMEGTEGTDEPKWKIVRYLATLSTGTTYTERMFPDGSIYYNKIWDNREDYNYIFKR